MKDTPDSPGLPLLLALAHRFPAAIPPIVDGWTYRRDIGAWVDSDASDTLMVSDPSPPPPPPPGKARPGEPRPVRPAPAKPKPRPVSKKFDRETGEDMKGE